MLAPWPQFCTQKLTFFSAIEGPFFKLTSGHRCITAVRVNTTRDQPILSPIMARFGSITFHILSHLKTRAIFSKAHIFSTVVSIPI